jgi:hypothetical protein
VVDPEDSHLYKSLGCAAENIVHAAAAKGFSADVRFDAEEDAIHAFLKRDVSAAASDLYRAIPERQCSKTAYNGIPIVAPDLRQLEMAGAGAVQSVGNGSAAAGSAGHWQRRQHSCSAGR